MNYYPFHIGDFRSGTVNMTRLSRWIYRDMLDVYYDLENPLSLDLDVLFDAIGADSDEERRIVERLLRFKFIKTEDGYRHEICDQVIANYRVKAETAKANGKLGGRPRNPDKGEQKPGRNPVGSDLVAIGVAAKTKSQTNQEPRTKNQEPEEETTSSSDDDVRKCPTGSLINLYHELMPLNPQCKVPNESRKSAIRARWLQAASLTCEPFGYSTKSAGLAAWRRFFEICAESKFLTGQAPPLPGKPAFVADIDFIFSPSGFAKTLENKYHRDVP